jgi:hypothetical protein
VEPERNRKRLLARAWTHSHEEDEGSHLVFRPSEHDFPPARGRQSFTLAEDGTLEIVGPGADDRPIVSGGTWSLEGDHLELEPFGAEPRRYDVDHVEPDRLVVKRVTD